MVPLKPEGVPDVCETQLDEVIALVIKRRDEAREKYDRLAESDMPSARAFGAWQALSDLLAELQRG